MKFAYLIEPPFNYRDAGGVVTGCDVDLARYVFGKMGIAPFEPVETDFAELLPGLASGAWRMTTGMFATPERSDIALFSRPVWALPDGLLVARGNPLGLTGYASVARHATCRLAVIRDQVQHKTALSHGVPAARICVFDSYSEAAEAVASGEAHAYASVAMAHTGFIDRTPRLGLQCLTVPSAEQVPAFGAFAMAKDDHALKADVDAVLAAYIGTPAHRAMMAGYGFASADIDLLLA